jgi:hypothetical protein
MGVGADRYFYLPWVMLGLQATSKKSASLSPADMVFGSQLVLPGESIFAADLLPVASFNDEFQNRFSGMPVRQTPHNLSDTSALPFQLPDVFLACQHVFVRRDAARPFWVPAYDGPFRVLERSLRFFCLQVGNRVEVVSSSHLKPAFISSDTTRALPLRRGRPRLPPPVSGLGLSVAAGAFLSTPRSFWGAGRVFPSPWVH